MIRGIELVLVNLEWAIFAYFLGVNGFYLVLLVSASFELRENRRLARGEGRWRVLGSPGWQRSMLGSAFAQQPGA